SSSQSSSSSMLKYTSVLFQTSANPISPGMSLPVQDRADADVRRALLRRDAVVLARPHRELAQAVLGCELAETAEVRPRGFGISGLRRHRHQAAHVSVEREEGGELVRRDSGLRLLAREVDLHERGNLELPRRRLRGQRMAELADPVDDFRLAALQVADEVPAERVAVRGVLCLEILGAVLTH